MVAPLEENPKEGEMQTKGALVRDEPIEEERQTKDAPVEYEPAHVNNSSHSPKPPVQEKATAVFEEKQAGAEPGGKLLKAPRQSDQEKLAARREYARRQEEKQEAELDRERKKRIDGEKQTKESQKRKPHGGATKKGRAAPRGALPQMLDDIPEDKPVDDSPVHDLRRKHGVALHQVELLEQELTRLRRVAQEIVVQLGDDERRVRDKKHTAQSIGEVEGELLHERAKVRQLAKHLREKDPNFPVNANGSLLTGGKHLHVDDDSVSERSHGLDDDKAIELQIRRNGETKAKRYHRRNPRHNRAKKNGMGDFLYTWVPDDWAHFTAYVMGIDDRLTPRR
jgi:hypothetical protein